MALQFTLLSPIHESFFHAMKNKRSALYLIAGFILVGLAVLGIILPLLPTTPLLLLAATCFANSSERWHNWLINHKVFGPIITNWHKTRTIPIKAKVVALFSILLFGTYAIGFAIENLYLRIVGTALLVTGFMVVIRIPASKRPD